MYNSPEMEILYDKIRDSLQGVKGWLSDLEMRFLASAAACPTAPGDILELGSYMGRSTIVLATAAQARDGAHLTTVDPVARPELRQNLQRAGVDPFVTCAHQPSTDLIANWTKPLRMFWLDGANDVATVTQDVQGFLPHLANRGIIAFHDILNLSGDRICVYMDHVLDNPKFGAAGICGSIGWAQYYHDAAEAEPFKHSKQMLKAKLQRLRPYHTDPRRADVLARCSYKVYRAMVPHHRVDTATWTHVVA